MTSTTPIAGTTFFGMDLTKIQASWMRFRRRLSKRILLIELDSTSITLSEAQIQADAVSFDHVRRYLLPEEALERGVPTDTNKMAALIRGFCQEAAIPAHRAAVVLSHDAVFATVVKLPSSIPAKDALEHALDPKASVQLPIQLDQMDVEVVPLAVDGDQRSYFMTAVPSKLVDRVLETLQAANMEMVRMQVGLFAQLQHLDATLSNLEPREGYLHLEMLRDCTQTTLLGQLGPIKIARLAAIRDFPEPPAQNETDAANSVLNTEAQIIASDAYLPLSDLDLRSLHKQLVQFMQQCTNQYPDMQIKGVTLSGVNSSHPMVASLLAEALGLPVQLSRPLATAGVGQFKPETPILMQSLGRLVGLGISLLHSTASFPLEEEQSDQESASTNTMLSPENMADELLEVAIEENFIKPIPEGAAQLLEEAELYLVPPISEEETPMTTKETSEIETEVRIFSLDTATKQEPASEQTLGRPEAENTPKRNSNQDLDLTHTVDLPNTADATNTIEMPNTVDHAETEETPFSLGDLMSSYESKTSESNRRTDEMREMNSEDPGKLEH